MTEGQGTAFLEALRAKQIRVKGNGWIEAACPLAQWTHTKHHDHTPSFGLSVSPGERSYFLCFACRQGSAEELLQTIELYSHYSPDYDFTRCHQILSDEEEVLPLPEYRDTATEADQTFMAWPDYWLESFTQAHWSPQALAYLAGRGVTVGQIQTFDLRYDTNRERIVMPYWDVFGRFAGARGRAVNPAATLRHYEYKWQGQSNSALCWYHESVLNLSGPVVVVEGQFDCIRTAQAWPKTVANMTAKPTLVKMKKLADCGTVVQIPDRNKAGEESVGRYARFCQTLGLVHRVVQLDEGVEDPAECHPGYLQEQIHAVLE